MNEEKILSDSTKLYARVQAIRAHFVMIEKRFSKIADELTKIDNLALEIHVREKRSK